jgi:predicted transglutaminase-like cysteine proteinase
MASYQLSSRGATGILQLLVPLLIGVLMAGCSSVPVQQAAKVPKVEKSVPDAADKRIAEWRQLIASKQGEPEDIKLFLVNDFFNRFNFVDDIDHWGKEDYWATPLETLRTNGGDCEDFVIGKYFTLKYLQVPEERMRITYVKAQTINKAHMVLTYYKEPEAEPLVLDNLDKEIKLSSRRKDLVPVYSFNAEGLWLAHERGLGKYVNDANNLSLWQGLLERMRNEQLVADK